MSPLLRTWRWDAEKGAECDPGLVKLFHDDADIEL